MNNVVLKGKLGAGFNDDRYTLPKDGNPGDILVKTETGSEWQKQEPTTSTPDWHQNDSKASDYIKNRPGGYTVNYPALNIEWDGVTGDKVVVNINEASMLVKVSDEIPKAEQLVGGTLGIKQGDTSQTASITDSMFLDFGNGIYGTDNFLVVNKAPADLVDQSTGSVLAVFPETGVYFAYVSQGGITSYVSSLSIPAKSEIVPIPREYVEGLEMLPKDGNPGDILVKTETGGAWQSFVEDMIEEDMLPAVKIGSDILGINNDILMM